MQEFNLLSEIDERNIIIGKLQRMLSSCQINVLLGSAFSLPQLQTLHNIESKLTEAILNDDKDEEYSVKLDFFSNSIYPIITTDFNDADFIEKRKFIKSISDIVDIRETSVVHKGINIFTTNYDNFIEVSLERNNIDYFDGFNGRLNPEFSTSNYGKFISKQSSITGRLSEKTSVNLYKLHGSVFWREENSSVLFEDYKNKFHKISSSKSQRDKFLKEYSKLAIINPDKNKLNSTVLNINYYDQLRIFSNEIERQNSILIVFGFSFADEHIMQIIERSLISNPTLTMLVFPYCDTDYKRFKELFAYYNNVYCYIKSEDGKSINLFELNDLNDLLVELYNGIK